MKHKYSTSLVASLIVAAVTSGCSDDDPLHSEVRTTENPAESDRAKGMPGGVESGGAAQGNPGGSGGSGETVRGIPIDLGTYQFGPSPVEGVVQVMQQRFAHGCQAASPPMAADCVRIVVVDVNDDPPPQCSDVYDPDRLGYRSYQGMSPRPPTVGDPPKYIDAGSSLTVYAQVCEYTPDPTEQNTSTSTTQSSQTITATSETPIESTTATSTGGQ